MTHITQSLDHFPYSVTLGTKGRVISRLSTRAILGSRNPNSAVETTLSWFPSLFYQMVSHLKGL